MNFDRFMIGPFNDGLELDLKPFMIADEAWARLKNAYIFRGRVKKRFGSRYSGSVGATSDVTQLNSRLRIFLDNTNGSGILAGTVPGYKFKVGQTFSIGTVVFTVITAGVTQALMRNDGSAETATFSTTNGAYSITCAAFPATAVYFYPGEPVQAITQYEQGSINNQPTWAFDTQFAYTYSGSSWIQSGSALFHGDNSDFYWATNHTGITHEKTNLFVSNFQVINKNGVAVDTPTTATSDDCIWTYDGTNWTEFKPKFLLAGAGNFVQSARIIVPFKDRLLLLNTIERDEANANNKHYPGRCRFSQNGSPFPAAPTALSGGAAVGITDGAGAATGNVPGAVFKKGQIFSIGSEVFRVISEAAGAQPMSKTANATTYTYNIGTGAYVFAGAEANKQIYFYPDGYGPWLEPNQPGYSGAGWLDAPTEEEIVSAGFIKDRLIVYFERTTWELVYNGNQILPFSWQKLNNELGSESTFSTISFDKVILTIGNVGITACNGSNVTRIDEKIPSEVFKIKDRSEGIARVAGIRDYYNEMVYWSFPPGDQDSLKVYPNKILVYNYKNQSWAYFDDTITSFGYFEQQTDETWAEDSQTWEEDNTPWDSALEQAQFRQVVAGNHHGFIFTVDHGLATNASVMQLTNLSYNSTTQRATLTIIDHNLTVGEFIGIDNTSAFSGYHQVYEVVDANTIVLLLDDDDSPPTTYSGGGTVRLISRIDMLSKQWNPYLKQGYAFHLAKIDFNVDKTPAGEITVDYAPSYTQLSMINDANNTHTLLGTNVLETYAYPTVPLETVQDQLWHPLYFYSIGDSIQIRLHLTDDQLKRDDVHNVDFQLNALILYTRKTSSRL